ncbi:bifunctional riboflavin kinase/FAD synthetase [Leptolyngbya ohadii]|uniref:bifunctional riboflavin kinase/FAD synthetase n=1 Tax=Leptolyngbya ohadii TaxID=1962290 RepID=UPI000B59FDA9|nr:bifunctional riboflavin kinase/FAD synthetase [Leptolyngbya ohadii]
MWITSSLTTAKTPTRVALGNFDGVHRGHQQVIQPVLSQAHSDSLPAVLPAVLPTVVTFHPHPRQFFTGEARSLLTPLEEKIQILRSIGVQQLVLLPFNEALANLSPEDFVRRILVESLQAQQVSVGENFCFGYRRSGTAIDLKNLAAQYDIPVEIVPLHCSDDERISSSAIREALTAGDPQRAGRLLGRPYELVGQIVQGQQLGRTIGFPTANVQVPPDKFLPRLGVYSVWVSSVEAQQIRGVMNIGNRPTVSGQQQTIEVHLLDWSGDLYGKTLTVALDRFLRPEQKFGSLDELKVQIQRDCVAARAGEQGRGEGVIASGRNFLERRSS